MSASAQRRDFARLKLCEMISHFKPDPEQLKRICEEPKLCRNVLSDYCPSADYKREKELLVTVVADGGAIEFYGFLGASPDEAVVRRFIRRMLDAHEFTGEGVKWAVESWLLALELESPEFGFLASRPAQLHTNLPPGTPKLLSAYDVFICYRRDAAPTEARLIRSALRERHIRAFVDVADLQVEMFDSALLQRVAHTPNFIVLLSPGCFDRSAGRKDWFRQEIVQALKNQRNVIQIMLPGFEFPADLPPSIRKLSRCNPRLRYSHELLEELIERIVRYVEERRLPGSEVDPKIETSKMEGPQDESKRGPACEEDETDVPPPPPDKHWLPDKLRQFASLLTIRKRTLVYLGLLVLLIAAVTAFWYWRQPVDYSKFALQNSLSGSSSVQSIVFSSNHRILGGTTADKRLEMWDAESMQEKGSLGPYSLAVTSVLHPLEGKNVLVFGYPSNDENADLVIEDSNHRIRSRVSGMVSFALSSDGKTLAGGKKDGTVSFWDAETGNQKDTKLQDGVSLPVSFVVFSPDGTTLASVKDQSVALWDWKTGVQKYVLTKHLQLVYSLAFSSDGKLLAGGTDTKVIVWDTATGDSSRPPIPTSRVTSVAFSPDSHTLAFVDAQGELHLWVWDNAKWDSIVLQHSTDITAFSFSPDGRFLLLGTGSKIEIWGEK